MRILGLVSVIAITLSGVGVTTAHAGSQGTAVVGAEAANRVAGQYVVVLDDNTTVAGAMAHAEHGYGASVDDVYTSALHGYAAHLSPAQAAALAKDPGVAYVEADTRVRATVQKLPSGIRRVHANKSPTAHIDRKDRRVNVDVAVIDSGVALNHPDLNVFRRGAKNCSGAGLSARDRNGHGTHVSGTIGALDNRRGVVGVAPGARIWPVRVLNAQGAGTLSDVLCGIDYVTRHARQIEVANLSFGGPGVDDGNCGNTIRDAEHRAICASVRAGVTYVVAAGNESANAALSSPANYDEVITVSALADFNGRFGRRARPTCLRDVDDTFANFSNFGRDVDVIAPGVCIRSTWPGGRYRTLSGTSMATPHVTGAAALFLTRHPASSPARVKRALRQAGTGAWRAADDPDAVKEPLVNTTRF